jgi:hypothetical protein
MAGQANDTQVGGTHYSRGTGKIQHWDMVAEFGLDYFQGQITRYLFRWRQKNGVEDLRKAAHYMEKYLELAEEEAKRIGRVNTPVESGQAHQGQTISGNHEKSTHCPICGRRDGHSTYCERAPKEQLIVDPFLQQKPEKRY